jgi:hypothetical protein
MPIMVACSVRFIHLDGEVVNMHNTGRDYRDPAMVGVSAPVHPLRLNEGDAADLLKDMKETSQSS